MDYKKDKRYKIGLIIFITAAIDVAVMSVGMFLGIDMAILPFFLGCIVMIIGNAVMVSVKYKYQKYVEGEPTVADRVRFTVYDIKEFFVKKGVLGTVTFLLLLLSFCVTVVFGIRTATKAYEYSGAMNAGYKYNLALYEENSQKAEQISQEADTLREMGKISEANSKKREAERFMLLAEGNLEDSEAYYKTAVKLKPQRDELLKEFYAVLGVNAIVLVIFIAELIFRKTRKRGKKS